MVFMKQELLDEEQRHGKGGSDSCAAESRGDDCTKKQDADLVSQENAIPAGRVVTSLKIARTRSLQKFTSCYGRNCHGIVPRKPKKPWMNLTQKEVRHSLQRLA